MGILDWIGICVILLGLSVHFGGLVAFLNFYFRRKAPPLQERHGITIIKPCHKSEDYEHINFERFFRQDYDGPFEIIFVISEDGAPIAPLVEKIIKKHPKVDARLLVSRSRNAYWGKIDAYHDAYLEAKHDFVVISDSDAVVGPEYVREMVASLSQPGVSLVSTPQYDFGANNFGTAVKTIGNNCDVAIYAMLMDLLVSKKKAAWGHSLGFKKSEFDQFGEEAWTRLKTCFGDDLILPTIFSEHGKKVVYRNIYCPVQYSDKSFSQMVHQQRRFAICQKAVLGTLGFTAGLLAFPIVTSTIYVFASGFSVLSLQLFAAAWLSKALISFVFEGFIFKSASLSTKYFWAIPIWDWLKVYLVFSAMTQTEIMYHGRCYKIVNGNKLLEVEPSKKAVMARDTGDNG